MGCTAGTAAIFTDSGDQSAFATADGYAHLFFLDGILKECKRTNDLLHRGEGR